MLKRIFGDKVLSSLVMLHKPHQKYSCVVPLKSTHVLFELIEHATRFVMGWLSVESRKKVVILLLKGCSVIHQEQKDKNIITSRCSIRKYLTLCPHSVSL